MKNNLSLKNIVALIAVILIWGYVFKTRFGFFNSESEVAQQTVTESYFSPKQYGKDTFELTLNNIDPFLKNLKHQNTTNSIYTSKKNSTPKTVVKKNVFHQKPLHIQWPKIAYYGYVKNKSKGKNQACIVAINSQVKTMHPLDEVNQVKLISVFKDSIIVTFNGEQKVIPKLLK